MAIQYYMRAYNTVLSQFVDWVVNDTPDTSGTFSGYPTGNLTNIVVNRVVPSKVENFLKPNHSLGGFDGYYFHVNSYDWLRATSPINPPTTLTGFAVERGLSSVTTVIAATNATPIQITTATAHGLATGALVTVFGVTGNIGANGTFPITVISGTSFTLVGSEGTGTYVSGGAVFKPTDFSTLTWDEVRNVWRFVVNTGGDGTTLGSSQNLRMLNGFIDGYASLGTTAHGTTVQAQSGVIRIPNNQFMVGRNPTNTSDTSIIGVDNLNRIRIGSISGDLTYMPGSLIVDGYIVHDGTGSNVSTVGFIREQNNTSIIGVRNAAQNGNIVVLSSTNGDKIVLGDATNTGTIYNTSTGNFHAFQVNSTSTFEIGDVFARFTASVTAPTILQTTAGAGQSGQTLTVQAQNGGTGTTAGGILTLKSGSSAGTQSSPHGTIDIVTGADGASPPKIRIFPTVAANAADSNSILFSENLFRIATAQVLPRLRQDDTTNAAATHFTIQAQNSTNGSGTGGNLLLTSGAGTTNGNVIVQTGGINKIIVTPTLTTILGNLLVNGTTSSIDSTVVEIRDRTINLNSSANSFPGTVTPLPNQVTGFAIDRGSPDGTTKRDYYGLFWTETDGYWKFAINTDGYTTQNALSGTLPLILSAVMAQPSATAPVDATKIPTVGGFRSLNNTVHSAARNALSSQDLILLSTDSANKIIHGAGTQNSGHIFNTTVSTQYDYQVNSVLAYSLIPISAGTTNMQAASTVTAMLYNQAATASATGAPTTLQAQNAVTTGGALILTSGTGTTAGDTRLQTGGVDKVIVHPTFTEFRDTAEALRITPVSAGTTQITYASTVLAAQINQTATAGTTGAPMTVQAQNAVTTGGSLTITSGTGATAGDVNIQTGAVSRVIVHPTFTEFRDAAEAFRITPVSSGATILQAASTATSVAYRQADLTTNSGTGAATTVQAQNETGTTSTGGALNLTSGTGTTTNGAVNIQVGGTTTASAVTNKFVLNKGFRRNVTSVTTTYAVLASDDLVAVTALAAPFTITLPATPVVGDEYVIKDATGLAGTNNLTISGNGANIDGAATFLMSQPYAAATFTFLNGQWSVT